MDTEASEIRFGVVAVKNGFVTPDQVVKALETQVMEDLNTGTHRLIGMILHDRGLLTLEQIHDVIQSIEEQR